jgi:hypothetical protein
MPSIPKSRIHKSLKRPNQILGNQKGILNKVYAQTRELLAIQATIRNFVPDNVHVASVRDGVLHLITNSSATATRIKYRRRNIVSAIRNQSKNLDVNKIAVSVRPEDPDTRPAAREPLPISSESANQLSDTAKFIEDDALKQALIKLSKRATKP